MDEILDTKLSKTITLKGITHFVKFVKENSLFRVDLNAIDSTDNLFINEKYYNGKIVQITKGQYGIREPKKDDLKESEAFQKIEFCTTILVRIQQLMTMILETGICAKDKEKIIFELNLLKNKFHTKYESEIRLYNGINKMTLLDSKSKNFTLKTIARYLHATLQEDLTENKANSILEQFGLKSGKKLQAFFNEFKTESKRIPKIMDSKKSYKSVLNSYEKLIYLCEIKNDQKARIRAEEELKKFIALNKIDFQ